MNHRQCSECGRQTGDWHYVRQRIQCRNCWELSNMPSYLRVQTILSQGKSTVATIEEE